MKRSVLVLLMLVFSTQITMAVEVYGKWATQKKQAEITIKKCGSSVCGVISKQARPGAVDSQNPDPKLRSRSMTGVQMFKLQKSSEANKWVGELYNPQDGKTYNGQLTVLDDNHVKIEGCILFICLGQTWSRI